MHRSVNRRASEIQRDHLAERLLEERYRSLLVKLLYIIHHQPIVIVDTSSRIDGPRLGAEQVNRTLHARGLGDLGFRGR